VIGIFNNAVSPVSIASETSANVNDELEAM